MPRAKSVVVDPEDLATRWEAVLSLRQPGFDWSGKDYGRLDRGQRADVAGLVRHEAALSILLQEAPTGFPTHTSLRDTFVVCDAKWGIFGKHGCDKGRYQAARDASDAWRKMCKDIYDYKKLGIYPPELKALVDLVQTHPPDACLDLVPLQGAPTDAVQQKAATDAPLQFAEFSDSDCELIRMTCKCPDCMLEIPSASSGAQRVDTLKEVAAAQGLGQLASAPRRRLTKKGKKPHSYAAPMTKKAIEKKPSGFGKKKQGTAIPTTQKAAQAAAALRPIVMPIQIVNRLSGDRPKESYIMQNTAAFRYVCGVSEKLTPFYMDVVKEAAKQINEEALLTPAEAKAWITKKVQEGADVW